jgi:hypothetical protein
MTIKQWLGGNIVARAQEFATRFADSFPSSLESSTSRKAQEMARRALGELIEQIVTFQRSRRMGILKKIVFARAFQEEMRKLGYSPAFIRQVTSDVLSKLAFAMKQ